MASDEEGGAKLDRRDFLKVASASVAGAVIPGLQIPESAEQKRITTETLIIDIAPSEALERSILQQDKFVDSSTVLEGFRDDSDSQLAINELLAVYQDHGKKVADAYYDGMLVAGKAAEQISVVIEPLQTPDIFSTNNLSVEMDDLGNPTYRLAIPVEALDKMIKAHPEQKIVNLSFPMEAGITVEKFVRHDAEFLVTATGDGKYYVRPVGFDQSIEPVSESELEAEKQRVRKEFATVEELAQPMFSIREGYEAGRERQVLDMIVQLARQNPNHVIVTSLANNPVDIRPAREAIGDDWPDNLILMGQWDGESNEPLQDAHGGDIYIDNREINDLPVLDSAPEIGNGSSFSAGFESGFLEASTKGMNAKDSVELAMNFATKRAYQDSGGNHTETLVLDGDSFKL